MSAAGRKKRMRARMLASQKNRCAYCGRCLTLSESTLDHVVPKSRGGNGMANNKAVACRQCNQRKGSRSITYFLVEIAAERLFELAA